jgi:hypothetical protein
LEHISFQLRKVFISGFRWVIHVAEDDHRVFIGLACTVDGEFRVNWGGE